MEVEVEVGSPPSYDVDYTTKRRKLEVRRGSDLPDRTVGSNRAGRSQQCVAYIESKMRQCVRWANDGDVYCCVHLNSWVTGKPASPVNTVPCAGLTVHGTRCKHRSLPGGTFCKKHLTKDGERETAKCIAVCDGTPKHYSLYCDRHVPGWLKRPRNGRTRIVSKEVFGELVRTYSKEERKNVHEACELFYRFFKTTQFSRKVPLETQLDWIATEASKRRRTGEILVDIVGREKARLADTWRFEIDGGDALCRGYACAICFESFARRADLQNHVEERHHVGFVEQCLLLQCAICRCNFGNEEELRSHAICAHREKEEMEETFGCKFCQLTFDYLPDLVRHHRTAHLKSLVGRQQTRGIRNFAYRMKSRRRFKFKNRERKRTVVVKENPIAQEIYDSIVKTKARPGNYEITAIARASCCNLSLKSKLEERYGSLPDRFVLKAAKLCSESGIQVEWHREGFVCAIGCRDLKESEVLAPALPRSEGISISTSNIEISRAINESQWETDECHIIIGSLDLKENHYKKWTILNRDISYGKESTPIACVVDEEAFDSSLSLPWESFEYITRPLISPSSDPFESLHLGCVCPSFSSCSSSCDHSYLFLTDFEDSRDLHGKPIAGRLPYDAKGRIILEEGYVVYECNQKCTCCKACSNRVLQNGVRLKLEIFKTIDKDWGVRAGEPILRGMFVCEYVGEILDYTETNNKRKAHTLQVNHHLNDVGRLIQEEGDYVIDATNYGNVARFINHSASSNLVNYQVIVESMDPRFSHIGLYASRDIATGEELTFNYRSEYGGRDC